MEDVVDFAVRTNWDEDYKNPITGFIHKITEAYEYLYEKIPTYDIAGNFVGFVNVPKEKRPK